MRHFLHRPPPPLSDFVDCFWLVHDGEAFRKERVLPTGTSELVVNLREDELRVYDTSQPDRCTRFSGAVMSGTYSGPFVCDAAQHECIFGVHFKPGGAFPFLGLQAYELSDAHADLEDLWAHGGAKLRERLCAAQSPGQQFQIVEGALLDRLRRAPKRHAAIQIALERFGPVGDACRVRNVAQEIGLSQRRFIELFRTQVGLTPKLLCRILRFQYARRVARGRLDRSRFVAGSSATISTVDWAGLASACGYYDQSHLINDFQEFSGVSPAEYLRRSSIHHRLKDNHVPLSH